MKNPLAPCSYKPLDREGKAWENIKLSVEQRQERGKGEMGRLRRGGRVPGIFYGPGRDTVSVCVNTREFQYKVESLEGSHLIEFLSQTTDLNGKIALLKDVQHHPVTAEPLHIDFYEIDVNIPIEVGVPVHLVGKAEGRDCRWRLTLLPT